MAAEYVEKALHAIGDKPTVADGDVFNRAGLFLEQSGKIARAEQLFRAAAKADRTLGAAYGCAVSRGVVMCVYVCTCVCVCVATRLCV